MRPWLTPGAVLALAVLTGQASAAQQAGGAAVSRCSVVGGDKLLAGAGGSDAVCREIDKAVGHYPNARSVTVEAKRTQLTARVELLDGRLLPEIGFALSDAPFSPKSIQKFAAHVAASIREAGR